MKLGALVFLVSALAACAQKPTAVPTSTTQLTSAEMLPADDAPRTGKPQLARGLDGGEEARPAKDGRTHSGGGFSGYK